MGDKTLYVDRVGAVLARDGRRLVVRGRDRSIVSEIPVLQVSQIVLVGNVQVTGSALDLILTEEVDTVFLTRHGRFKARLDPAGSHFSTVRLAQYAHVTDSERRIAMARAFVEGKLRNMRTVLSRRRRAGADDLETAIARLDITLDNLPTAATVEEIRGHEGIGSKAYFSGFRDCLKQDMGFERRARRPPPDPINALLSFGYTILASYCDGALRRVGLDTFLGYLHEPADRKPSLTLDFMEEFRPLIVDTVVLAGVNRIEYTVKDFKTSGRRCTMNPTLLARFVDSLETRLDAPTGATSSESSTFRLAMVAQARQLVRIVTHATTQTYRPLAWR